MRRRTVRGKKLAVCLLIAIVGFFGYSIVRHRIIGVTEDSKFDRPQDIPVVSALLTNLEATDIFMRRTTFDYGVYYWITGATTKEKFENFVAPLIEKTPYLLVQRSYLGIEHMNRCINELHDIDRAPGPFSDADPIVLTISTTDPNGYRWTISAAHNVSESKFLLDLHFSASRRTSNE